MTSKGALDLSLSIDVPGHVVFVVDQEQSNCCDNRTGHIGTQDSQEETKRFLDIEGREVER